MTEQVLSKSNEKRVFLLTTFISIPLVAIAVIGVFGVIGWVSQMM